MDKIICQVCGTSYPGTASQCPICGYAKPEEPRVVHPTGSGKYQHVRGGRFSSDNVRKRMESREAAPVVYTRPSQSAPVKTQPTTKKGSNFVFGIIAIILLVVLIMALAWFIVDIIGDRLALVESSSTPVTTEQVFDPQILANTDSILFEAVGDSFLLEPSMDQGGMGAVFFFESSDPLVASVDDTGNVTAVGAGSAVITIYSGSIRTEVAVTCDIAEPTEPTYSGKVELNRKDITFSKKGETWDICSASVTIPKNKITWTSDNEKIARIENGVVTAVGGPGVTKVHGEYNGQKVSCTIRTSFTAVAEDPVDTTKPDEITISHKDVTIAVGESFTLTLKDADKKTLEVQWKVSEEGIVDIDGNTITGAAAGKDVIVSATYEGKTYKCTVRIKDSD